MGLADDRKPVNLMTVHVSKSVTVHEVSNNILFRIEANRKTRYVSDNKKGLGCGLNKGKMCVSAKYCYVTHELRLHQNDRCKRLSLF